MTPSPAPSSRYCPLEDEYELAVDALVLGAYDVAQTRLDRVRRACPNHPYAVELLRFVIRAHRRELLGSNEPSAPRGVRPAPARPVSRREIDASQFARIEVVSVLGLVGAVHGGLLCLTVGSCNAQSIAGSSLALGLAFGGVATVATMGGIRPGEATAVTSGAIWGSYLGAMIGLAGSSSYGPYNQVGELAHIGMLVGLGTGALVAVGAQPTSGRVALVDSAGLWAGAVGGFLSMTVGNYGPSAQGVGVFEVVSVSAGLAVGAVLGHWYPVTRGRMFLVDVGTSLGGALSVGIAFLIPGPYGSGSSMSAVGALGAIGVAAGFVTSMALTHRIDVPAPRTHATLVPVSPDGRPGVSLGMVF